MDTETEIMKYIRSHQKPGGVTRAELVDVLGLSVRTVARKLKDLSSDGVIQKVGHGYQIATQDELHALLRVRIESDPANRSNVVMFPHGRRSEECR